MRTFALIFALCMLALAAAAPSWGHGGAVLVAPSHSAVVSSGHGGWGWGGWGHGGWGHGGWAHAGPVVVAGPSGTVATHGSWGHGGHW